MGVKPAERIMEEIKKVYDRNQNDWKVLRARDKLGHYDTYISHKGYLWQLKTEFKAPYQPIGVGSRISRRIDDEIESILSKGDVMAFGEIYRSLDRAIIALGLGHSSQKAANQMKKIISSKQENLERELTSSLRKLLHKEGICKEYG
jgi:hypothetical protein